ncbi:MAG: hypothetical protein OEW12_04510 [Deltaproteobacteria bacterium]|nr:hypothetical protein [Deltaproteobacteria bacterium]
MSGFFLKPIPRPNWAWASGLFAVMLGAVSIKNEWAALSGSSGARALGYALPFLVYFHLAMGAAYIVAGVGLYNLKRWAAWGSLVIALASLVVGGAYGLFLATGGAPSIIIILSLGFRAVSWTVIGGLAWRNLLAPKS